MSFKVSKVQPCNFFTDGVLLYLRGSISVFLGSCQSQETRRVASNKNSIKQFISYVLSQIRKSMTTKMALYVAALTLSLVAETVISSWAGQGRSTQRPSFSRDSSPPSYPSHYPIDGSPVPALGTVCTSPAIPQDPSWDTTQGLSEYDESHDLASHANNRGSPAPPLRTPPASRRMSGAAGNTPSPFMMSGEATTDAPFGESVGSYRCEICNQCMNGQEQYENHLNLHHSAPSPHAPTVKDSGKIKIYIQMLEGKTITFDVECNECVSEIKQLIQNKEAIPLKQQRLFFAGKELEDTCNLKECNVEDESTLHLNTTHPEYNEDAATSYHNPTEVQGPIAASVPATRTGFGSTAANGATEGNHLSHNSVSHTTSDRNNQRTVVIVSSLSVAWMATAWNTLQLMKSLVALSPVTAFWVPLISLLLWSQLLIGFLQWSNDMDSNLSQFAESILHSVFLGYCCMTMSVLFNRRWKEWKFRKTIVYSRSAHGFYQFWMIPLIVRSLIGVSFGVAVYGTFSRESVHVSVPLISSTIPLLIFVLTESVLFFGNRSLTLNEKWEIVVNQEISKAKTQWFLMRYVLWFTVIPLLAFQWVSALQIVEASVLNLVFAVHSATRMVLDGVVFTLIQCKRRRMESQSGSLCTFPVHSKAALGGSSTPTCGSSLYCEAYFHEMVSEHVDETGCLNPAVLKEYAFKVLERDIKSGVLDETTLYQLLDTMVTMPCDQIFYLLKGLMKPTNDKVIINIKSRTPGRRKRGRVPTLNAKDLRSTGKSRNTPFAMIPESRRTSYLRRVSENTTIRVPSPVSEGSAEWIYDWMSVSAESISTI